MTGIVVVGGSLHTDPATPVDVRIRDGHVAEVGAGLAAGDDRVVDAAGCVLVPGLVDLRAHLREPGREEAETIRTGTTGAVLGGFTAVVAMPNTEPTLDSPSAVRDVAALAERALCEVVPAAALTVGRDGALLTPMGELTTMGVRIFTDANRSVADAALMRRIMEYATGLTEVAGGDPIVISHHCEEPALSAGGHMHEGEWSTRLGIRGAPREAETIMLGRDLALARKTGCRLHVPHVSAAESVAMIADAKAQGLPVTADVSVHHLCFVDADCAEYDPVFKVSPPLRTAADRAALLDGVITGVIDAITTDHAPHEPHTKEFPFDEAPSGVIGFETALAALVTQTELSLDRIVEALSVEPARIAGIGDRHGRPIVTGEPANCVVFDPTAEWTVDGSMMASRSHNTPWHDTVLRGRVRHTIVGGQLVVDGGVVRS